MNQPAHADGEPDHSPKRCRTDGSANGASSTSVMPAVISQNAGLGPSAIDAPNDDNANARTGAPSTTAAKKGANDSDDNPAAQ